MLKRLSLWLFKRTHADEIAYLSREAKPFHAQIVAFSYGVKLALDTLRL